MKILPGVWSLKGYFDLVDYGIVHDGSRNVFRFILRLSDRQINRPSRRPGLSRKVLALGLVEQVDGKKRKTPRMRPATSSSC